MKEFIVIGILCVALMLSGCARFAHYIAKNLSPVGDLPERNSHQEH